LLRLGDTLHEDEGLLFDLLSLGENLRLLDDLLLGTGDTLLEQLRLDDLLLTTGEALPE